MYKYLIIGVALLFLGSTGYYFNKFGGTDLMVTALTQDKSNASAVDVFSGTYECTNTHGCDITTRLLLHPDATIEVTTLVDSQEVFSGKGTWGIAHGNSLVILFDKSLTASSTYPSSLIAKKVSTMRLSDFVGKKKFPWMVNPTFIRVANDQDTNE